MDALEFVRSRRTFISQVGFGAAVVAASRLFERGVFADELDKAAKLPKTSWVEEGPFYPPNLPLDTDNDLLIVNNAITPAVGTVAYLGGRLLDANGNPLKNATIEIWQVDSTSTYLPERNRKKNFDANFQGFGRFLTGSTGEYYFRTIQPVPYQGRPAPHIHFKIKIKGQDDWTTQLFIKNYPGNLQDGVYDGIGDQKARDSVTREFAPVKDSRIGEVAVNFDIVPGQMPADDHHDGGN